MALVKPSAQLVGSRPTPGLSDDVDEARGCPILDTLDYDTRSPGKKVQ